MICRYHLLRKSEAEVARMVAKSSNSSKYWHVSKSKLLALCQTIAALLLLGTAYPIGSKNRPVAVFFAQITTTAAVFVLAHIDFDFARGKIY